MRHLRELKILFYVLYLTQLLNIDMSFVFCRLTRMADDLEDDVEKESSGLKSFHDLFYDKPRTLSQVIAQAGRPFKKPQVQNIR